MEVIPAIDIKGGRCVRLYQGDFNQETVFSEDPVAMARHWESEGATRLHVVDLDGAARGSLTNEKIIAEIARMVSIPVEVGGGIRTLGTIYKLLALGIQRVILGTVAIEKPDLVKRACQRFGEGIVIGIDARDGFVATRGWKETTQVKASDLAAQMVALGAKRIIYTDISRDGTMTEPNFAATEELIKHVNIPIIASGGISSPEHLKRLAEIGAEGAIVGRALYEGKLRLGEALA